MLLKCDNKGCCKDSEALLDVAKNQVICQECGQQIKNISDTMKRVLKNSGQIIRSAAKKAFMMGCTSCKANREVVFDESTNTVCKVCGAEIKVHPAMKQAMMEIRKLNTENE